MLGVGPHGPAPFYAALANLFLAAPALQMRPPSGWMRCTPQPYPPRSRTPREIGDTRPPRSRCAEQRVPSSLAAACPRPPCAIPAISLNEWRKITHFETSGGKSCTLQPISLQERFKNRHSFGNVRKAATHLKPVRSRAVTIDARLVPLKLLRFKNCHSSAGISSTGDLSSSVRVLGGSHPHFSKLIEVRTLKPSIPSRRFITPSKSWGFVH